MWYLFFSIICSVAVGIAFKISRRYEVSSFQIVLVNYVVALLLSIGVFKPDFELISSEAPFGIYIALGILLPLVFIFLFYAIKNIGIVKTDAAQRLSLCIPILAAWLWFDEKFTFYRLFGIALGFLALFCILLKPQLSGTTKIKYPLLVFIGYGIIDILFKKVALFTQVKYSTSLAIVFAIALLMMVAVVTIRIVRNKEKINVMNVLFGILVGFLNFGNIWFYLHAHSYFASSPSTVFAGMNMGVITIGSLVGVVFFKEKLSKWNYLGLLLALISVFVIVWSSFF
ncbi:DMT family transporter [Flavobacterium agrisoli]|uniref:DMT family transporter n=1 Tax=Flavobacterium agrisoli TaxID=2793066 RepID=A0A934PL85_9FLAO|nr:DMT family transporter [Flavobacterium agrisoli]MBK0370226.1 DMT family transporter [Flavobacterium agrisoli]